MTQGGLCRSIAACTLALFAALSGCGEDRDTKFRAQVQPIVAKVSELLRGAAAVTGKGASLTLDHDGASLTELAGLAADLLALSPQTERQRSFVSAGQAYLSGTQRFLTVQQDFARMLARLDAARGKVKDSLDAKLRTSQYSMDFWKETHVRLEAELEKARKDATAARDRLAVATDTMQQSADATIAFLGSEAVVGADVLAGHRKALEAIPIAKDP